jgi:hypothetical protein
MSPSEIIDQATSDGLTLMLAEDRNIKAGGDTNVIERWLPFFREHKAAIIELLRKDLRKQRVLEMLSGNPALKYAVLVDQASSDPVCVMVAIRGIAAFELEIPQAHYDGIALLEVLDQHSTADALKPDIYPFAQLKEHSQTRPEQPQRKVA